MVLFFARVEHEQDAGDGKGYAKELAHIQSHGLLKVNLNLLAEFYEEAESEDSCNAESKVES